MSIHSHISESTSKYQIIIWSWFKTTSLLNNEIGEILFCRVFSCPNFYFYLELVVIIQDAYSFWHMHAYMNKYAQLQCSFVVYTSFPFPAKIFSILVIISFKTVIKFVSTLLPIYIHEKTSNFVSFWSWFSIFLYH